MTERVATSPIPLAVAKDSQSSSKFPLPETFRLCDDHPEAPAYTGGVLIGWTLPTRSIRRVIPGQYPVPLPYSRPVGQPLCLPMPRPWIQIG